MKEDKELVGMFAAMNGVEVTHHYLGADNSNDYFIHCKVNDNNLRELVEFTELTNCNISIYTHGKEYRYCVKVPDCSRRFVISL